MAGDLARCLAWVKASLATRPDGTRNKVVLIGHSSGAHICAHLLLQAQASGTSPGGALPVIDGFVGLAGVYDIGAHFMFEAGRGVEWVSSMHRAMNGRACFQQHSPTWMVRRRGRDRDAGGGERRALPRIHLFHGAGDATVPPSSSVAFVAACDAAGGEACEGGGAEAYAEASARPEASADILEGVGHVSVMMALQATFTPAAAEALHVGRYRRRLCAVLQDYCD